MIFEVLQIITEDLNDYLGENAVALSNIASVDGEGSSPGNSPDISLSLVNLQEEFSLKNTSNNYTNGTSVSYKNPKVYLNLYVLFSVDKSTYTESLKSLTKVIEFFQGKRVFTHNNTNYDGIDGLGDLKSFKFITQLYTPSFEELNYIWGTLGGKQYPSALYKVTLLEIERDMITREGKVVSGIQKEPFIKN
ncbi:Protein of unknown function [Tenacibaculum sp. MAR_2009_124]|uniref:DUF4255 domain-containing protein n=1 Tax=Tenacibaculum sp. MAR_2009_124 TaxID=1250059 RepID=UPI00089D7547|nr:DUF4255 domain-containing protein [Tenacibaculum sp. MAR_2009_124]SEC21709.1 Protein of unknown function [Tenacibaculum sp. MAR_2009_124]